LGAVDEAAAVESEDDQAGGEDRNRQPRIALDREADRRRVSLAGEKGGAQRLAGEDEEDADGEPAVEQKPR